MSEVGKLRFGVRHAFVAASMTILAGCVSTQNLPDPLRFREEEQAIKTEITVCEQGSMMFAPGSSEIAADCLQNAKRHYERLYRRWENPADPDSAPKPERNILSPSSRKEDLISSRFCQPIYG